MSSNHASMNIPAHLVIHACEAYLEARYNHIERQREAAIQLLMTQKIGFFGRLIKRKLLTREAAIAELKEGSRCGFSEWQSYEIWGGLWASRVEDLLALALAHPSRVVRVSSELGSLLEGFWPKEVK